ncbi:MAG: hypothetical protein GOV15_04195, partial [Candidatus Diapherotrites archaeon]|nr:hypothetical protein [Candidatus Diapherotrites archaeon]
KSPALKKLEDEMHVPDQGYRTPPPKAPSAAPRNEPVRAFIIVLLVFASVMLWTFFIPVVEMDPDVVFKFQGDGNIFEQFFDVSFILFLLLSPLTYALVAAFGIRRAGLRGIYCSVGILFGVLLSFFVYSWPLYYLLTGIAYAFLATIVYKMSAVKFVEFKWWNSFRATSAGAGAGVNYALIILVLTAGFAVFPQQDVWFQKSIYSMLDYATPSSEGQLNASQQFSAACFDQIITELKNPIPRGSVVTQLETNPTYLALPTQELKDQYVDQAISASNTQKDLLITQLETSKTQEIDETQLQSREAIVKSAYDKVIETSPMLRQMKKFFGLFFIFSLWFTVIMFKGVLGLIGGLYGGLLLKFFKFGGMF